MFMKASNLTYVNTKNLGKLNGILKIRDVVVVYAYPTQLMQLAKHAAL